VNLSVSSITAAGHLDAILRRERRHTARQNSRNDPAYSKCLREADDTPPGGGYAGSKEAAGLKPWPSHHRRQRDRRSTRQWPGTWFDTTAMFRSPLLDLQSSRVQTTSRVEPPKHPRPPKHRVGFTPMNVSRSRFKAYGQKVCRVSLARRGWRVTHAGRKMVRTVSQAVVTTDESNGIGGTPDDVHSRASGRMKEPKTVPCNWGRVGVSAAILRHRSVRLYDWCRDCATPWIASVRESLRKTASPTSFPRISGGRYSAHDSMRLRSRRVVRQ